MKQFYSLQSNLDFGKIELAEHLNAERSLLDLKMEIAGRILQKCHLCERRCCVNRVKGDLGYCKCGTGMAVSSIFAHWGEEPELVPSGTIFTMGCTMRCKHCQNWTISQWEDDFRIFKVQELAEEIVALREQGCRNINLVGGEPTPWLKQWFETFRSVTTNVPIVWNSNSYYSSETAELLAGFVDIYLLDFKYGPSQCAKKISETAEYWRICARNHLTAKKYGALIVRVLVLPTHNECCTRPILNWIAGNLGTGTRINLMFQYKPEWRASEFKELQSSLAKQQMQQASQIAEEAGLTNVIT